MKKNVFVMMVVAVGLTVAAFNVEAARWSDDPASDPVYQQFLQDTADIRKDSAGKWNAPNPVLFQRVRGYFHHHCIDLLPDRMMKQAVKFHAAGCRQSSRRLFRTNLMSQSTNDPRLFSASFHELLKDVRDRSFPVRAGDSDNPQLF